MSETTLRLDRPLKMVTICLGQMQTNCYIVENTKTNQAFVFDPGDQGERIMNTLEEDGMELDMLIANYVYEKVGVTHKKVIHYRNVLPQDEIFRWDDMGHFRLDQYILMHSVIYRTDMLKLIQLHLPKHTFYVDNIYVRATSVC